MNKYASYASPTFVDLDDDGDMDCVIGFDNGEMKYYENIGDSNSPNFSNPIDIVDDVSNENF